jgi:molybdopterin synthase sulfur carrier subunit
MPRVVVPPVFQGPTRGQQEIKVGGKTIRECLEAVDAEYAGFLSQVLTPDGAIQRFVKLFVNEEQVADGNLDMTLEFDDEVEILAAIAGG